MLIKQQETSQFVIDKQKTRNARSSDIVLMTGHFSFFFSFFRTRRVNCRDGIPMNRSECVSRALFCHFFHVRHSLGNRDVQTSGHVT